MKTIPAKRRLRFRPFDAPRVGAAPLWMFSTTIVATMAIVALSAAGVAAEDLLANSPRLISDRADERTGFQESRPYDRHARDGVKKVPSAGRLAWG